jgi:hypothetical protein
MRERVRVRGEVSLLNSFPLIRPSATFSLREKGFSTTYDRLRIFL